jgi:hypothetical protein
MATVIEYRDFTPDLDRIHSIHVVNATSNGLGNSLIVYLSEIDASEYYEDWINDCKAEFDNTFNVYTDSSADGWLTVKMETRLSKPSGSGVYANKYTYSLIIDTKTTENLDNKPRKSRVTLKHLGGW